MAQKVEFPGRRHEMILQIKDLSDFEMQKEKWTNPKAKHAFWDNAFFAIDMILNECCFDEDEFVEGAMGYKLRNDAEGKAVKKVAQLLMKTDEDQPDSSYLNSPLWQEVVQAAQEAYAVLMENEDLDELLRQENARNVK